MTVKCPGCKRTLKVPDSAVGKTVACPACKTPVKVEEKLEIMLEGAAAPAAPSGAAGSAAGQSASCANCGFPLLPTVTVCNRCGTNRFSGMQDPRHAGYQAGVLKRVFGRAGWILTLIIGGGIAFAIYTGVTKSQEWVEEKVPGVMSDAGKPGTKKPSTVKPDAAKPKTAKPDAAKPDAPVGPSPAEVARQEKIAERFEEAFALLMNPLPESQRGGKRLLAALGASAVPHVADRFSESQDPVVRLAMLQALVRLKFPEATAKLAEAIGDEDDDVREAAIKGLVSRGKAASDLVSVALGSDDSRVRSAAIRIAAGLHVPELTPGVMAHLNASSAQVRWQAAKCLTRRMATEAAIPKLIAALDDKSLDVAVAAARSLASQPKALPLVLARFDRLAGGSGPEATRMLVLLSIPILASRDALVKAKLAERICADQPLPDVIAMAKRLLTSTGVNTRVRAMRAAREEGNSRPPMPLIAGVSLMDSDIRIRASALKYFAAFPSEGIVLPLIIAMGDSDLKFAMSTALEVGRRRDESAVDALRLAAEGAQPLRSVLAAGVLARKGDPAGAEILERAAFRDLRVPPSIPSWAAYQLSFLGNNKELAGRFAAEGETATVGVERAWYTAAAARLGDEGARKKLAPMLFDRQIPADARVELAGLLSKDDPEKANKALIDMLSDDKVGTQIAALGALADIGDPKTIPGIMERVPFLLPGAAEVARTTVVSFGKRAEPALVASISSFVRSERVAALEILARLGEETSKAGVKAVVNMMITREKDAAISRLAAEALSAMTGRHGKPGWTGREWARALRVRVTAAKTRGVEVWDWIMLRLPSGWDRRGNLAIFEKGQKVLAGDDAHTSQSTRIVLRVYTERDPEEGEDAVSVSKRRYKDSAVMSQAKHIELCYEKKGKKYFPLPKVSARKGSSFIVGSGKVRARASTLVFTNEIKGMTEYYVFLVYSNKEANWYAELKFSFESQQYFKFKTFLEKQIPRSMQIVKARVE